MINTNKSLFYKKVMVSSFYYFIIYQPKDFYETLAFVINMLSQSYFSGNIFKFTNWEIKLT